MRSRGAGCFVWEFVCEWDGRTVKLENGNNCRSSRYDSGRRWVFFQATEGLDFLLYFSPLNFVEVTAWRANLANFVDSIVGGCFKIL